MKKITLIAALLLAACQTGISPTQAVVDGPLTSEADFATIYGKRLGFGDADFLTINANGTLSGEFSGTRTLGTWEIRDGFWCRELTAGPRGPSPENCQMFVRSGNTLNVTLDRGEGSSFSYTVG